MKQANNKKIQFVVLKANGKGTVTFRFTSSVQGYNFLVSHKLEHRIIDIIY